MNSRWHIAALILFLTLIGVVGNQQTTLPNQEIVVEFTNSDISQSDTQSTITIVKEQLQGLGAKNIQVKEGSQGKLRIIYHSTVDVAKVKNALSENNTLIFEYVADSQGKNGSELPLDGKTVGYNLDINEIQNNDGSASDFGGKSILTLNYKGDHFYGPDFYSFCTYLDKCKAEDYNVSHKLYEHLVLAIQEPLHIIPEVRAGPIC